jgi:hypothetical protein
VQYEETLICDPVAMAGRQVSLILRIRITLSAEGGILSGDPLAVLIEEAGTWSQVMLSEDVSMEDLIREIRKGKKRASPGPGRLSG